MYSFVPVPTVVNLQFLGIINLLTPHNILLAIIVAFLQYLTIRLTVTRTNKASTKPLAADKAQMMKMQQNLMLYAMPVLFGFITFTLPSVAGLYFAVANIISVGQELLIRRQLARKA